MSVAQISLNSSPGVVTVASYQSRRDYLSTLYKPVMDALEKPPAETPQVATVTDAPAFSIRHGYVAPNSQTPITIREDAL